MRLELDQKTLLVNQIHSHTHLFITQITWSSWTRTHTQKRQGDRTTDIPVYERGTSRFSRYKVSEEGIVEVSAPHGRTLADDTAVIGPLNLEQYENDIQLLMGRRA